MAPPSIIKNNNMSFSPQILRSPPVYKILSSFFSLHQSFCFADGDEHSTLFSRRRLHLGCIQSSSKPKPSGRIHRRREEKGCNFFRGVVFSRLLHWLWHSNREITQNIFLPFKHQYISFPTWPIFDRWDKMENEPLCTLSSHICTFTWLFWMLRQSSFYEQSSLKD